MCRVLISARHACSASAPRAQITIVTGEGEERAQPEETNASTNESGRLSFSQTDYSAAAGYWRCSAPSQQRRHEVARSQTFFLLQAPWEEWGECSLWSRHLLSQLLPGADS